MLTGNDGCLCNESPNLAAKCNDKETPVIILNGCVRASMCVTLTLMGRLYVNFKIHSAI